MDKTLKGEARLVKEGTILVMASATVGRAIVAMKAHEDTIISHHFMRVEPLNRLQAGWVYAYLRSPQAKSMMTSSQYASVIRHIEPHHLGMLPVPMVAEPLAAQFSETVSEIVRLRNNATDLTKRAEDAFTQAVNLALKTTTEVGFAVSLRDICSGRRRIEGAYHSPETKAILTAFKRQERLDRVTKDIWLGQRFKRSYGDGGVPYLSADDVFTTNAEGVKSMLVDTDDDHEQFFVKKGWLVMSRSGQTYGMIGSTIIATQWHENSVFSDDMIRIVPNGSVRPGFLLTALTHPTLGRPLLIREAYGTSIPHLEPEDVAAFPVVRFDEKREEEISSFAELAAEQQALAEVMERQLAHEAGEVIADFMKRPSL